MQFKPKEKQGKDMMEIQCAPTLSWLPGRVCTEAFDDIHSLTLENVCRRLAPLLVPGY